MNQLSADFVMLSNVEERYLLISKRLREERKRLGLSQVDLANSLNISVRAYGGYEKSQVVAPVSVLIPLADLGADILYIVTGERTAALLSPQEQQMISALRAATPSVQAALLSMLKAGVETQTVINQKYAGGVGQVIEGNLKMKKFQF
ncbi:helix-turn-helix domain-containing protein [Iodobacter sp.]|uniref:helix-turn-helix domain-containing protein n=1 Tax=Iodobacter sp. TaxID=1915058 RepID=UPI0025FF07DA|nr:helix-turn-helix transcriptional regulator [Iodobacter sp.]